MRLFSKTYITIMACIFVIWVIFATTWIVSDHKELNRMKPNLGKQVVLDKDTLTIIKVYSDSYMLSNKTVIDKEVLPHIILK